MQLSLAGRFGQSGLAVCGMTLYFDVIQHAVHGEFGEHDDLLDAQNPVSLW